jgi:Bacterial Ig-like domain (group 1)
MRSAIPLAAVLLVGASLAPAGAQEPPAEPLTLTLDPQVAENIRGSEHCLTATLSAPAGSGADVAGFEIGFSVTGVNPRTGSGITDSAGQTRFCYVGSEVGNDDISAFADMDEDGAAGEGEPRAQASKRWISGRPTTITLTPADAANDVGTNHTVTARVQDADGQPAATVVVLFTISGSTSRSGSCTTDAGGQCRFTYAGPQLPGADLIRGCADSDGNGQVGQGEPCFEATKAWMLPTSTAGQVTGGGQVPAPGGGDQAAFGFEAKSSDGVLRGSCTLVDPTSDTKVKCLTVTSLVRSGTHATFFGRASVNGVETDYRIDVDDLAEPGRGRDTFRLDAGSAYRTGGTLARGNVQIH